MHTSSAKSELTGETRTAPMVRAVAACVASVALLGCAPGAVVIGGGTPGATTTPTTTGTGTGAGTGAGKPTPTTTAGTTTPTTTAGTTTPSTTFGTARPTTTAGTARPTTATTAATPGGTGTRNVQLAAGFLPDPFTVPVSAGGPTDVSTLAGGCAGLIDDNVPNVSLTYTAGGFPLTIAIQSATDTSLVIDDPNGQLFCMDRTTQGEEIVFPAPASGVYDIWVGNFTRGRLEPGQLVITER